MLQNVYVADELLSWKCFGVQYVSMNMLYRENLNKLFKQWWFSACYVVYYLNTLVCVMYQIVCVMYTIWICVVMLYDVAM